MYIHTYFVCTHIHIHILKLKIRYIRTKYYTVVLLSALHAQSPAGPAAGLRGPEPPNAVSDAAKRPSAARRPLELMNEQLFFVSGGSQCQCVPEDQGDLR